MAVSGIGGGGQASWYTATIARQTTAAPVTANVAGGARWLEQGLVRQCPFTVELVGHHRLGRTFLGCTDPELAVVYCGPDWRARWRHIITARAQATPMRPRR